MSKVNHGKRYYKQMSLEVAVRNPERYYDFLMTYNKFEGVVLNDENILNIFIQLYLDGVVTSKGFDKEKSDFEKAKDFVLTLSHNNEWGFPTGYQAAFTRYLKTLSEFGFIYAQYNEVFRISAVGKAVISKKITLSEAFALQSMRFWRKSPYRRVLNDFNYFEFIYKTLIKLQSMGKKLSYPQFMVSLFSDNGNVEEFISLIQENNFGNDLNKAYNYLIDKYNIEDNTRSDICKIETAFNDYGNTVFRLLQLTGFITVDYSNILLLSINNNRLNFLERLFKFHFSVTEEAKESEEIYFNEIGSFSNNFERVIIDYRESEENSTLDYNKKIPAIIKSYNLSQESLAKYIIDVSNGKKDRGVFWYIQEPLKFEFLLALFLYASYGDKYQYRPNYKCDDFGIPYSHAPGNIGDIEIYDNNNYWLVEATLIRNKNQQVNNETINLFRHINKGDYANKYLSLVAPYIHEDTQLMLKAATIVTMYEQKYFNLYSYPQTTSDFVKSVNNKSNLIEIKKYSEKFIEEIKDFLFNVNI